ncbi:ankyrin [Imleria badia]|nr:ankyrin [Imleria badia]
MHSAGKTLVNIASVSRRVLNTLNSYTGHKTVESFQLEKIVVASGTILETLNGALFLQSSINVDDRLKDWLSGEEPKMCLDILNRMEALLNPKLDHGHGVKNFFRSSRSVSTKDKSNEAIKLFWKQEGYFHFLLSTEIWNRESGARQQQPVVPPLDVPRTYESPAQQDLTQVSQRKAEAASSTAQEGKTKRPEIDVTKLNRILEWLHAWSCSEINERTLLLRQPDTCIWLPNTNAYRTWKNAENSFLWLHGKAGAGKSVLAASVIDTLKCSLQDGEVLAYFYCDFRNERSTSVAEVMRSLLSQLLQRFRRYPVDAGDLIEDLIEEMDAGVSTISNAILLSRYVSRVAKQFNRRPFFVIDALDECTDVQGLLNALAELRKGGMRLFATSRPLQIIKVGLSGLTSIDMDMMKHEVSSDINLHVKRVLDSHRRLRIMDTSLKNEMFYVLCEKADAMFRWVQCQLSTLERCVTAMQIREVLDDLPKNLHETYERILIEMNEDEREGKITRRALHWLVAALAPLQLSQLMEGLSIDPFGDVQRIDGCRHPIALQRKEYLVSGATVINRPAYHVDEQAAHRRLALLCMCYISIYLEQGQRSGGYEVSPQSTHKTRIWVDGSVMAARSVKEQRSPLPTSIRSLDEYVLSYGFCHLSHINPGDRKVLHAIKSLHWNAQQHPSEWDQLRRRSRGERSWPTLKHDLVLFILIAFAPPQLLRSFVGRAPLKPKDGTNPLIYAARTGAVEHARILLSKGVSVNRRGWDIYLDHHQLMPLQVAVDQRNPPMVDLFLAEGSPVPHELFVDPLTRYSELPHHIVSRLLQTDEFAEWAANAQDEGLLLRALDPMQHPAFPAYQPSQQEIDIIQRRLVQVGCDPSTRFNETSLRHAVSAGHISEVEYMLSLKIQLPTDIILDASRSASNAAMIRLCLSKGCNINFFSSTEDTPLHLTLASYPRSEDGCSESIQVLIDAGCNPSTCNLAGETPLHLAIRRGYVSIVEYLLALHVPLPPDILLTASKSPEPAIIPLLISKGADVHVVAANGDTPLHRALDTLMANTEGRLNCVKELIDAGCNPWLRNADGKTPFDLAIDNVHLSVIQYLHGTLNSPLSPNILLSVACRESRLAIPVVQFLINKGADIRVARPSGDTLLHITAVLLLSGVECLRRIKLFVNAGCDPHACNLAGETPFHIAAQRGHIEVMEYLISLGISVPSDIMITQFEGSLLHRLNSVPFLLDKGGDVHAVAKNGDTLLHLSARLDTEHGALELAKHLVQAGCAPCALNSKQETPLHIAARSGFTSVVKYFLSLNITLPPGILIAASTGPFLKAKLIRYLVQEGATVSVTTSDGDTPLHLLLARGDEDVLIAGDELEDDRLEGIKVLVDSGCDPRAENTAGETPLHAAARSGFTNVLEYLLSQGVPLPRDILLASEIATTLRFFLAKGLGLRTVAPDSVTDLMCRVLNSPWKSDPVEFARVLISAGWDPSAKNSAGETIMHAAARRSNINAIRFFLSQDVPPPSDILLAAVSHPARANAPPPNFASVLEAAVRLTRLLIREGAGVNFAASNGDTPLHLAITRNFISDNAGARCCSWELIEVLLNSGSDPSARNADGQTPHSLAEAKGHFFKENFQRLVRNAVRHRRVYVPN